MTAALLPLMLSVMVQGDDEPQIVTKISGLRYYDEKVGDGESPVFGEVVKVNYIASYVPWYTNLTVESHAGTKYDSTYDRSTPFEFTIGSNRVTPGMNEATESMHVGGKRVAFVPAKMGYGHRSIGDVPPNSTLILEISLLDVKGLDERGAWGVFNDTVGPHVDPTKPPSSGVGAGGYYSYADYYSTDEGDSDDDSWAKVPTRPKDNSTADYSDYDDMSATAVYIHELESSIANVSARLDSMLGARDGTVATGATWVFDFLAAMAVVAVVGMAGHWLYSQHKKKVYFQRLREDYRENVMDDVELDDL